MLTFCKIFTTIFSYFLFVMRMSNPDKPDNEDDKAIHLPEQRQVSGRHIEIVEEESVIPVSSIHNLTLADAKLQAHQADILAASARDGILQALKDIGLLRDEQVEINSDTGDCLIKANNGERMSLGEYMRFVREERIEEEARKYRERKENSQDTD